MRFPSSYLSTALFVSREELGADRITQIRKALTFRPRHFPDDEVPDPVECFDDSVEGFIGLPVAWGQNYLANIDPGFMFEDRTNSLTREWRAPRLPDPNHPAVENPRAQSGVMVGIEERLSHHRTCLVKAPTGTGKTACSLWYAGCLGGPTVVVVHLDHLVDHWIKLAQELLGLDRSQIGRVQGTSRDWQDKAIVVCTTQTLVRGTMPEEFYSAFSLLILDEAHRFGSKVFSRVAFKFNAHRRLGMSATPSRRDDTKQVITAHLGEVSVDSEALALRARVHVLRYRKFSAYWGETHGARIMCVARDRRRNKLIVSSIKRMYDLGRNILVISDRIEHLQGLIAGLVERGVPCDEIGQYTRTMTFHEDIRTGDRVQRVKKRRTVKKAELVRMRKDCRILAATYGMLSEGFDMPRLDAGIDATPRSQAEQVIGRIRRPLEGKPLPLWVTIRDMNSDDLEGYYRGRLADYNSSNVEVVDHEREYR